jgi:hypothetical protein
VLSAKTLGGGSDGAGLFLKAAAQSGNSHLNRV